jgi:hypothetical protein
MPGIRIMREEYFFINDNSVYQFFGHQPVGFSSVIEKFTKGINNSYLINLDTSLSFRATANNVDIETMNSVEITQDGIVKTYSKIKHNLENLKDPLTLTITKDFFNYNKDYNDKLVTDYVGSIIIINNEINKLNSDLEKFNWLNTHKTTDEDAPSNVYFNYHGRIDNNYIVFSVYQRANPKRHDGNELLPDLNRPFRFKFGKTYYILSDAKFNEIYNVINPPLTKTVIASNNKKFREKYLKYKSKYLALKNNL